MLLLHNSEPQTACAVLGCLWCSELVSCERSLEELQEARAREAFHLSRQFAPNPHRQQNLKKMDEKIAGLHGKLAKVQARLQEEQDLLQRLAVQQQQLVDSADKEQQLFAAQQVQAVADALLELSYAAGVLIKSTAATAAPNAVAAADGWLHNAASAPGSGCDVHCHRLSYHMQLAEAISRATTFQFADSVHSHEQVLNVVHSLQVGGI